MNNRGNAQRNSFALPAGFGWALAAAALIVGAGGAQAAAAPGASVRTLDAAQVRNVGGNVNGPEGPSVLPDGSVALVEFMPGNIVAVHPDGRRDVLAHIGSGVTGTLLGKDDALYVAKMDVARFMRRAGGEGAAPRGEGGPAGAPPAGPAPAGGPPPGGAAPPGSGAGGVTPDSTPAAIVRIDLKTRATKTLYTQVDGKPLVGPNDLAMDAWGDLWLSQPAGDSVLNARTDGSMIKVAIDNVKGVNGITLSPDKRTLYVMDGRNLTAFSITGRGTLKMQDGKPARRVVMVWPESIHEPDGLKTEASGNLLGGCWGDGIVRVSPQGKILSQTIVPGQLLINMAFSPRDNKSLFISAHPAESMLGGLVVIPWDARGIP